MTEALCCLFCYRYELNDQDAQRLVKLITDSIQVVLAVLASGLTDSVQIVIVRYSVRVDSLTSYRKYSGRKDSPKSYFQHSGVLTVFRSYWQVNLTVFK